MKPGPTYRCVNKPVLGAGYVFKDHHLQIMTASLQDNANGEEREKRLAGPELLYPNVIYIYGVSNVATSSDLSNNMRR